MFLSRRLISTVLYMQRRRISEDEINFKTIGLLLVETTLLCIEKLWHPATVIKLLFRFSKSPLFSTFVSQHVLKGVNKNKSSSVLLRIKIPWVTAGFSRVRRGACSTIGRNVLHRRHERSSHE